MIHCYKLCGYNIVLDVASGCVHSVDDVVFDVIGLYDDALAANAGPEPATAVIGPDAYNEIVKRASELHPDATEKDIRAIITDIENLIGRGKLFSPDVFAPLAEDKAAGDAAIKALCLNVSHVCNMRCAYCFANRSIVTGTACKAPDAPGTTDVPVCEGNCQPTLMPFDTGKQAIDFLIENSTAAKTLDIDFFGGEPLLNWRVVKELVAYARMAEKFSGKKFRFTLTTNGLLIDDDVIDFTNKQFHNVVLSLDGRPETHDAMRKLPGGTGSYEPVLANIRKLVKARREKGYYIRGTFTRRNMDFTNDIFHIADELEFRELSLEPAVTGRGDPLGFTQDDLPELCRQYDILAAEMQRRRENAKYVRPEDVPAGDRQFCFYHFNLDLEDGPCVHKRVAGCGAGTQYLAVTPGGELYPCHQFIGDDAFLMGDVWRGVVNKDLLMQFAKTSIYSREQCKSCWARFYCSGGCAANAYHDSGSINGVHRLGCELFKKRIENAIMLKF